jgi:hypothetical protein
LRQPIGILFVVIEFAFGIAGGTGPRTIRQRLRRGAMGTVKCGGHDVGVCSVQEEVVREGGSGPAARTWQLCLLYSVGVWCAITLWAAVAHHIPPPGGAGRGKDMPLVWAALVNVLPALLCWLGFGLGMTGLDARRCAWSGQRARWTAFAAGVVFPVTAVVLRPMFAWFSPGLLPALVWALVGSLLVALALHLVMPRR